VSRALLTQIALSGKKKANLITVANRARIRITAISFPVTFALVRKSICREKGTLEECAEIV
jgi:hypothetical protein